MFDDPNDENMGANLENIGSNPQDQANVDDNSQVEVEPEVENVLNTMIEDIAANPERLIPRPAKLRAKQKIWHLSDVFGGSSDEY